MEYNPLLAKIYLFKTHNTLFINMFKITFGYLIVTYTFAQNIKR
jgi:hypothetical protein